MKKYSFEKLDVWEKSSDFVNKIYDITAIRREFITNTQLKNLRIDIDNIGQMLSKLRRSQLSNPQNLNY